MGHSSINGPFSVAMLNNQRLYHVSKAIRNQPYFDGQNVTQVMVHS